MVLAPLTRGRSGESRVPNEVNVEYYAQRASAGLLITEATAVSAQGYGWGGAPGIYTEEQKVTKQVEMRLLFYPRMLVLGFIFLSVAFS